HADEGLVLVADEQAPVPSREGGAGGGHVRGPDEQAEAGRAAVAAEPDPRRGQAVRGLLQGRGVARAEDGLVIFGQLRRGRLDSPGRVDRGSLGVFVLVAVFELGAAIGAAQYLGPELLIAAGTVAGVHTWPSPVARARRSR